MKSSSLAAAMLAALLSLACSAEIRASAAVQNAPAPAAPPSQEGQEQDETPADAGKAKHPGPRLEFGRAAVKGLSIEQGNTHTAIVRAESLGTASAHVSRVTVRGEGVSVTLIRSRVARAFESGKPIEPAVEVPSGQSVRFDIVLDPAGLKMGDHAAVLELETDGNDGKPIVLPIDWEIVAPQTDEKDEAPEAPTARRGSVLK